MADEPTGTQPGEKPGAAPTGGAEIPPAGKPTDPPAAPKTFTQEDVNRMLAEEKRKAKEAGEKSGREAATSETAEELAQLRKYRDDAEAAKLTEAERQQAELDAERKKNADLQAKITARDHQDKIDALVAQKAPHLDPVYAALVSGDTDEQIEASLKEVVEAFEAAEQDRNAGHLAHLVDLTPDQIVESVKDAPPEVQAVYRKFAERLAGRPVALGAAASTLSTAPAPPTVPQIAELAADRRVSGAQRQQKWIEAMSQPATG